VDSRTQQKQFQAPAFGSVMDAGQRIWYEDSMMGTWLTSFLGVMLIAGTVEAGPSWPQFRGPNGDGTSTAKHVPVTWSESNNITWKVALPGRGRSSPVALKDRIWLTTALEQGVKRVPIAGDDMQTAEHVTLGAVCLESAHGKILWHKSLFDVENPAPVHWYNSWATPTPVIEPGRLYCDFGTFGTACLDAKTGKTLWQTQIPVDHQVGPGSSSVLWRNLLVLARDGRDAQFVIALDKKSGKTVWKTDRPPIESRSGNLKKSFVTPLVVSSGGRTQLVSPAAHWVVSYDPSTGKELWRARHGEGFSIGSCPVFSHGLAIFSTGCMKAQLWAVRADGEGDVTATHVAWKTPRQVPVMSSPVLAGNEVYWVSDEGMASCADAQTGEMHWQERLGGLHLASPLYAEGRIYFFAQDGKATVIKAGKQFEKLAENHIEGPVVATPAILDGAILLRTDSHLLRIGKR
jgi:outer membrane protein assembly factor BamB